MSSGSHYAIGLVLLKQNLVQSQLRSSFLRWLTLFVRIGGSTGSCKLLLMKNPA